MTKTETTVTCPNEDCEAEFDPADALASACPVCQVEFCDCRVPGVPCSHHNHRTEA
jgi:hypothetical protein